MKKIYSIILNTAVCGSSVAALWSCSAENPFDNDGHGVVQLRTVVNSIMTRAEEGTDTSLEDKCVVYISDKEGLVYKKQGLKNVDSQITLKSGSYVAEAWTGDSVTASFDKKFYRGYQPFDVAKGSTSNVVVNCRIANVVASINTNTINPSLMQDDYQVTIKNSRGELTFTKDNAVDGKAYFMMPTGDNKLEYTISGSRADGDPFTHTGVIEGVERAHHYILNFEYNPQAQENSNTGYVFIKINIKDEEIKSDNVTVFTRPTVTGIEFDIEKQLKFIEDEDIPEVVSVQICGDGLSDIILSLGCCTWKEVLGLDPSNDHILQDNDTPNFANLNDEHPIISLCKSKGLEYIPPHQDDKTGIETAYLNFSKEIFQRLIKKDEEHVFTINVADAHKQKTEATLRIARTEAAVEVADPIELKPIDQTKDYMSVKANSANISFKLSSYEGVPGVEYAKVGEDNWTFVAAPILAAAPQSKATRAENSENNEDVITITGLEPGTSYKYRACCGDFRSDDVMTFTTESIFVIPNASMEEWSNFSENSKVLLPSAGGVRTFWDSGNHGSATMNKTLTQNSEDMAHSGTQSAKLRSQFVGVGTIGKFAAGNLFAGTYVGTDGTDGILEFGREYNGSHPSALSVWANYRPGTVDSKGKNDNYLKQGDKDQAQIYVALSTKPVEIRTKNASKLFNPNDPEILAYGQVTWTDNFGPDGQLENIKIPLEYNDKANTTQAKYLIIVCSASKYGDYFCGGEGSTMYLDDFELIYE